MKKLMQIALVATGLAGFGRAGLSAELKIATFDFAKAFNGYYKTIQSKVALSQEINEAKKEEGQMLESARKHEDDYHQLIDKANDQAVSAEEREKAKKAVDAKRAELVDENQSIKDFDSRVQLHLRAKEDQRTEEIVKEIRGVVNAHAKTGGYSMVLDSSETATHVPVLLYSNGQDDLTDSIIKELNAAAPPGSLDTNAPAASTSTNLLGKPTPPK